MNIPKDMADQMRKQFVDELIREGEGWTPPVEEWDEETEELIAWLRETELPQRFQVNPWTFCSDGSKLQTSLLAVLEAGPESAEARAAAQRVRDLRARLKRRAAA